MKDIKNPRLLWIKGGLLVVLGLIAFSLVVLLSGNLSVVVATSIAIWAFCRAYYFAFYVIEHYIDGRYRFAGLTSLLNYWLGEKFGSIEANVGTVEPFADAIDRKSSRWPAIRCWLLLLVSPITFWLLREVVHSTWKLSDDELPVCIDLAMAGTWFGGLAFWIARGTPPLPWRLLIGLTAAALACSLFSLFPFTISYLWSKSFREPFDYGLLACCVCFFATCLAMQFLLSLFSSGRLRDQLLPTIETRSTRQLSIRYLLCIMTATAILLLIFIRGYGNLIADKTLIEHVFSTSMAAVFSVFVTNVAARIILRTDVRTQLLAYPIILGWVVVSPVLNLMINMWSFGSLSWEVNAIENNSTAISKRPRVKPN